MNFEIKRARREKLKVPIMLMGASGSGKTMGALLMAKGMMEQLMPTATDEEHWDKIGLIDTEHRRSELYVDTEHDGIKIGAFLKIDLEAPFNVGRLSEAIQALKGAGVEVLIIDSLSAMWSGSGGILDQVGNKGLDGWREVGPEQKLQESIFTSQDVHIISTVRTKQSIEVSKDESTGKTVVEKVPLKVEQKDSLEYEFAITFTIYENHIAESKKDNSSIFNTPHQITRETGRQIIQWAEHGVDVRAEQEERRQKAIKAIEELAASSEDVALALQRFDTQQGNHAEWKLDWLTTAYKQLKPLAEKKAEEN